jgi:hypothetical protein
LTETNPVFRCPLCRKLALRFTMGVLAHCMACNSWMSAKNNEVSIITDNRGQTDQILKGGEFYN